MGLPVELCCCLTATSSELTLCSFVCVVISDTTKGTSRNLLYEIADTPKYVAHVLRGAVSKGT